MNWDVLGHEWAIRMLSDHAIRDRLHHAYLLTGPRGVGRRTIAVRFAQLINCTNQLGPGIPCRGCHNCIRIERMQHPDVSIVQAEQEGGNLKVDQVRDLQRSLSLTPYEARYRVALLLRFEEANDNAANALLKTLEEPSPRVLIILTARSVEDLLPTIVSRCEVIRLRPIPLGILAEALQSRWEIPAERARLLAHLSGGRPGYALRLYHEPERLELRQQWLDDHRRLLGASRIERFTYADNLTKDRDRTRRALETWLTIWRDVLLRAVGVDTQITNVDRIDEIDTLASRLETPAARQAVWLMERTLALLSTNVNARLATEVMFLELPKL